MNNLYYCRGVEEWAAIVAAFVAAAMAIAPYLHLPPPVAGQVVSIPSLVGAVLKSACYFPELDAGDRQPRQIPVLYVAFLFVFPTQSTRTNRIPPSPSHQLSRSRANSVVLRTRSPSAERLSRPFFRCFQVCRGERAVAGHSRPFVRFPLSLSRARVAPLFSLSFFQR